MEGSHQLVIQGLGGGGGLTVTKSTGSLTSNLQCVTVTKYWGNQLKRGETCFSSWSFGFVVSGPVVRYIVKWSCQGAPDENKAVWSGQRAKEKGGLQSPAHAPQSPFFLLLCSTYQAISTWSLGSLLFKG